MFENIGNFFKKMVKTNQKELGSKDAAKERLHLVLMQDRANVSADFLELMKQEIIDVIKKYIIIDESAIDVRLTNQSNDDGTNGAPALYANIPIVNIKNDMMTEKIKEFEGEDFQSKVDEEASNEDNVINESDSNTSSKVEKKNKEKSNNIDESSNDNKKEEKTGIKIENSKEEIGHSNSTDDTDKKQDKKSEKDINNNEDEEDFDLTFDDLLKVAEEEEKRQGEKQGEKTGSSKKKKK